MGGVIDHHITSFNLKQDDHLAAVSTTCDLLQCVCSTEDENMPTINKMQSEQFKI